MTHTHGHIRSDWTREEIKTIMTLPMMDLLYKAQAIHRQFHNPHEVQPCRIQSIKTGACPEDCKYCPQSAHHKADIEKEEFYTIDKTVEIAKQAKADGATRFCMGMAWRNVPKGPKFDELLATVKAVDELGLEVCVTAGMLTKEQAVELKKAGCTAYNHNLDTSPEYYPKIISTRTYEDRLNTIAHVRESGISVCSGGIIGLGESLDDRVGLLHALATLSTHPESVPINLLAKYEKMPLNDVPAVHPFDMVRMVATARILMPQSMVRLSAGRTTMSDELHALCYFAGANSIFMASEKMFITPNVTLDQDQAMLASLGMQFSARALTKEKMNQSSCHELAH